MRFARTRTEVWVLDFGDQHNQRKTSPSACLLFLIPPRRCTRGRRCQALTGVYSVSQAASFSLLHRLQARKAFRR